MSNFFTYRTPTGTSDWNTSTSDTTIYASPAIRPNTYIPPSLYTPVPRKGIYRTDKEVWLNGMLLWRIL